MRVSVLLLLMLSSALPAAAAGIEVVPGIHLDFSDQSARWKVSAEPPEFLITRTAAHMEPGMLKMVSKGTTMTKREAAQTILSANELFLYNLSSEANLVVDFSPLRDGEAPPSEKTVEASARYAGESLETEDGLSHVSQSISKTSIKGASSSYRLDARYNKHGQDVSFIGIIGFAEPYWFFLYYTDFKQNSDDLRDMESLLQTVRIVQ